MTSFEHEPWAKPFIVYTGQHCERNMSNVIFQDLGSPALDLHLGVGSSSHAEQSGQVMIVYENVLLESRPDLVIVVGEFNSTYLGIACLTLSPNTERPITIHKGTNRLCVLDDFEEHVDDLLSKKSSHGCKIDLWDGRTADRVVASIKSYLKNPTESPSGN